MSEKQIKRMQTEYKGVEKTFIESNAVIKEFTYALDDFSEKSNPQNASEHRSYVYALCERIGESLIPFYIGEGKGPRVWSHELEASDQMRLLEEKLQSEGILEGSEEFEERKSELHKKIQKITEIRERNGEVVKYIIKWGMTSKEAFMAESALINLLHIGGLKFDASCQHDGDKLTNKVHGHQSEGEKQTGYTTARTVEEFCEEFAKEPLYFEDLQRKKVKAILININSGYPICLQYASKAEREKAIRDTASGNWKMRKMSELEKLGIEYIFATVQARVIGIYKIKEVDGKKFHYTYESVNDNSKYPHGEGTVPFRNWDYAFAKSLVEAAKLKGKHPSELVLDDMSFDFKKEFIENAKNSDPSNEFKNALERKYMILEDISEDDPNYGEFKEYLHRRIIHTDKWVELTKIETQKKLEKAKKAGKKKLPNPDKVTNGVYGSGNPLKYIEGKIKE